MKKYILIFTNDLMSYCNIHGRVQAQIFDTHAQAYEKMKEDILLCAGEKYEQSLLSGLEFSDCYLGEDIARLNKDGGSVNYYWKIIEVACDE